MLLFRVHQRSGESHTISNHDGSLFLASLSISLNIEKMTRVSAMNWIQGQSAQARGIQRKGRTNRLSEEGISS